VPQPSKECFKAATSVNNLPTIATVLSAERNRLV